MTEVAHYCEIVRADGRLSKAVCRCSWESAPSSYRKAELAEYHHLTDNGVDADPPRARS